MKKFVGISSILLLSSVLANTGVSLASAAETKEEAKVIDTTKSKKEKKSSSDDTSDSSTEEKDARDIASTSTTDSTEESSVVEEVDGTPMLQDPTKDLMDKITESAKEESSRDNKDKEINKADEKVKDEASRSLLRKSSRKLALDDWHWDFETISGKAVVVLKSLKNPKAEHVSVPSVYKNSLSGQLKPCYLSKDAFKGNKYIKSITFEKAIYQGPYSARLYDPRTNREVYDGSYLFSHMPKLTSVDFSGIDIRRITDFSYMFLEDKSLVNLTGLSTLDVSSGRKFVGMFQGCENLRQVDINHWDLSQAETLQSMFQNCKSLTDLSGLSLLDVRNVTDFSGMFRYCESIRQADLSRWHFNQRQSVNLNSMFQACRKLMEIRLANLPNRVNLNDICQGTPVVYAQLLFARDSYLASNVNGAFSLNDLGMPYIPLAIYSNSQSFLIHKEVSKDDLRYYTYRRNFAGDGRVLPFILVSGQGLFKNAPYVSEFDTSLSVHFKDEKICMLDGITNGYATNVNPIQQLSNPQKSIEDVIQKVKPYPTIQEQKDPIREDKSRFFNNYYKDETKGRLSGKDKVFKGAPAYLRNIFAKVTAQYVPVNPEMSPGHAIDSKNPNSKDWPENRMPQGNLGFCYQPDNLTTKTDVVLDDKDKSTPLVSGSQQNFHLGVRDFTNTPTPWSVNATLTWNTPILNDATITGKGGPIKKNMNNIDNKTNAPKPFNDGQLNPYDGKNVTSTIMSGFTLQNGKTIQLMKADGRQPQNFYDLTLGNLTLNTKDNGHISPKSYSGQIDWNLTTGPNGN
ncbi:BspA family leucine-rich repeat surface protein [Catellicoccus marimammalium]|uniref:BspA family leucine-rich repeat surface protein n=1 Tax=Catellicoccus marimammalium M35/04/3 TaxID=1234409 RepID=K8ZQH7_9ENTE|nr:BspA family leucine-rich repeat surface protein [Catellicoccus marimammalium]EKU27831.1 hypothetical protein C683_0296 [Catellicoccus marimammalium M35/04/3]